MRQIEPVVTTWQIGLCHSLRALNLNTDFSTFIPSTTVKSMRLKRATWLFGEGHQLAFAALAAGELASIAFCKSWLNCAISQPCNFFFFQVPNALNAFMCVSNYGMPPFLAHSPSTFMSLVSMLLLCCCMSGWSLQRKDMSLIPVVMISTETRWSSSKIPSYLLEDCCHID